MVRLQALFPPRYPETAKAETEVWNWARNAALGAVPCLHTAHSEAELQALITRRPGRVRAIGNRMSPGWMLATESADDRLIDISPLSGLLSSTADSATFGAGTPLQEVFNTLSAMGRMLNASPGVIAAQTLAGAISTGTHGQGLDQSSLADEALSIRFVDAAGEIHEWSHSHPHFGALQLGLGVLGVITAVTLRTRPFSTVTCFKQACSADTLGEDVMRWNRDWRYSKAWWFPNEEQVHVWNAREATAEEYAAWQQHHRQLQVQHQTSSAMNDTVDNTLTHMRTDTQITDDNGKPFRTVTRFKDFSDVSGDIYQVFCRGIATPQINIEIAVPLARAAEVIGHIREWHRREKPHLHYPIILRATGPSQAWLSPAYGAETLFLGFVVYYAADGSLSPAGVAFLQAIEPLLAAFGGRPHWGKYFQPQLYRWQQCYPRWAEFQALRQRLDPEGRFANRFCRELFQ